MIRSSKSSRADSWSLRLRPQEHKHTTHRERIDRKRRVFSFLKSRLKTALRVYRQKRDRAFVAVLSCLSKIPVDDVLEAKGWAAVRIRAVPNTSRKNTYTGVHTGSVPNEASSGSGRSSDRSDDVGRTNIKINVRMSVDIDRTCKARRNACTFRHI